MNAIVSLITASAARAELCALARAELGYIGFPPAVWNREVESEALVRMFASTCAYGANGDAEAPMSGELPIWAAVRWERIAARLGLTYDGTREGARSALKDEALLRTQLSSAQFLERAENAFVLQAAPFFCSIQELPPMRLTLPLDWETALVDSDEVPWRLLHAHQAREADTPA